MAHDRIRRCRLLVEIVASTHGAWDVGPGDLMVEAGRTLPASPVARVRSSRDGWTGSAGAERHVFALPLGIGHNDAQVLQSAPLWWWHGEQGQPCWQFEDAAGHLAERAEDRRREREKASARGWRHGRAETFAGDTARVNPYNFVPLGGAPVREGPTTHLRLGEVA